MGRRVINIFCGCVEVFVFVCLMLFLFLFDDFLNDVYIMFFVELFLFVL